MMVADDRYPSLYLESYGASLQFWSMSLTLGNMQISNSKAFYIGTMRLGCL